MVSVPLDLATEIYHDLENKKCKNKKLQEYCSSPQIIRIWEQRLYDYVLLTMCGKVVIDITGLEGRVNIGSSYSFHRQRYYAEI